jgi:hypothetical protein
MAEFYKKAIQIPTTGLSGSFIGFQNVGSTAQSINIIGSGVFSSTKVPGGSGITLQANAGAIVPIACNQITPQSFSILGFIQ